MDMAVTPMFKVSLETDKSSWCVDVIADSARISDDGNLELFSNEEIVYLAPAGIWVSAERQLHPVIGEAATANSAEPTEKPAEKAEDPFTAWQEIAAAAYRAYAAYRKHPSCVPLPSFEELSAESQTSWRAAVRQAVDVHSKLYVSS